MFLNCLMLRQFFEYIGKYLHFRSNPLMNLQIFASFHSLMNYTHLIDSSQAHLPVQYAFARNDTGVVIDSEPHASRTCKTNLLFALLAVCVQTGCSTFPFYTPT